MQTVPLKLAAKDAARMRAVIAQADFPQRLRAFLDGELIEIAAYENLAALCWNRRSPFIVAEEAFRLYERNWRYVNVAGMKSAERALIERLKMRYGNGVLNV